MLNGLWGGHWDSTAATGHTRGHAESEQALAAERHGTQAPGTFIARQAVGQLLERSENCEDASKSSWKMKLKMFTLVQKKSETHALLSYAFLMSFLKTP